MSFDGQVDWKRMLIGPVWPLAIIGKPRVAAPAVAAAAPVRNLRREAASVFFDCSLLIESSSGIAVVCLGFFVLVGFGMPLGKRLERLFCSGVSPPRF